MFLVLVMWTADHASQHLAIFSIMASPSVCPAIGRGSLDDFRLTG
jgi:hypothetical protein